MVLDEFDCPPDNKPVGETIRMTNMMGQEPDKDRHRPHAKPADVRVSELLKEAPWVHGWYGLSVGKHSVGDSSHQNKI